jgi:hypothetical protein
VHVARSKPGTPTTCTVRRIATKPLHFAADDVAVPPCWWSEAVRKGKEKRAAGSGQDDGGVGGGGGRGHCCWAPQHFVSRTADNDHVPHPSVPIRLHSVHSTVCPAGAAAVPPPASCLRNCALILILNEPAAARWRSSFFYRVHASSIRQSE